MFEYFNLARYIIERMIETKNRISGCILGGAIGDALGSPIEFESISSIRQRYGPEGLSGYVEFPDGQGKFTDDTQMLIFTAEGALRAYHRGTLKGISGAEITIIHHSYLRWLHTQNVKVERENIENGVYDIENGWIINLPLLHRRRAPGNTCLAALKSGRMGTPEDHINNSKGCGGIMRIAPIPLLFRDFDTEYVYEKACAAAAITHGHPSGYISAGCLCLILRFILQEMDLEKAVHSACEYIRRTPGHEETLLAVEAGIKTAKSSNFTPENLERLGGGWTGDEALAISIACSMHFASDFKKGILASVNHSGDSDSTGSITGNILGLLLGKDAIPGEWIANLEGAAILEEIADDLFVQVKGNDYNPDDDWWQKYPGY